MSCYRTKKLLFYISNYEDFHKKGPYNLLNKIKGEKSPFNKFFFSLNIVEKAHGDIIIHCVVLKVNNTSTVFIKEFRVLNNDENVRY